MLQGECEYPNRGWAVMHGYIRMLDSTTGKQVYAHRWRFEHHHGRKITWGLELGHLCHNPPCWNPDHLREMTHAENMQMRRDRQTHCKRGHLLSGDNMTMTSGRRRCKACARGYYHKNKGTRMTRVKLGKALSDLDLYLTSQDA